MSDGTRIELADCENTILEEIAHPESTDRDIALTYRLCIMSSESGRIDWRKVNEAIRRRFTKKGWLKIKRMAWTDATLADVEASVTKAGAQ